MKASENFRWDRVSLLALVVVLVALVVHRQGTAPGVDELVSRLAADDPAQVTSAVDALVSMGEAVVPQLVEAARDNPGAAAGATRALARVSSPMARGALAGLALSAEEDEARHQARVALARLGDEGVEALAPLLRAEPVNDGVRAAVIQSLGINPSAVATEALISALENQPATVRAVAVEVLTDRLGDLPTLALGKVVREDESTVLREIAALGLGERGDDSVMPTLLLALADPDLSVRYAAASAIEQIGDTRAIAGLVDALDILDLDSAPVVPANPGAAVDRHVLGIRIALCLRKLTGIEHGVQVLAWRAWLKLHADVVGPQLPSPF